MTNNNKTTHPFTIWSHIKDDIEFKIINGELRSADKVPSIAELAGEYDVSKSTAQKALEDLYHDKIINKMQGKGFFVIPYTKEKLRLKHIAKAKYLIDEYLKYVIKFDESDITDIADYFNSKIADMRREKG